MKSGVVAVTDTHFGWRWLLAAFGRFIIVLSMGLACPCATLAAEDNIAKAFAFLTGARISQDANHQTVAEFNSPHGGVRIDESAGGILTINGVQGSRLTGVRVPAGFILKFSDGWTYNAADRHWHDVSAQAGASTTPPIAAPSATRPASTPIPASLPAQQGSASAVAITRVSSCPAQAITCLRVTGHNKLAGMLPVTFGQPFKPGDVPAHASLAAHDNKGNPLPLQIDGRTTHPDGSLRFAILSTVLPGVAADEARTIAILRGEGTAPAIAAPSAGELPASTLKVELTVFSNQVTLVKFGNRKGTEAGISFQAGETITLIVGGERFALTVAPAMSGGSLNPYMYIAQAFVPVINKQSKRYRASWHDANDGYEKLWITTAARGDTFDVTADYGGKATISIQLYISAEKPELWVAHLDGENKQSVWLDGSVAEERDIALPLISQTTGKAHSQLSVRLHLRRYPLAKAVRTDVVVENGWAYEPGPSNYTYDASIRINGQVSYSHADINHYHHSRWHKIIWSDGFDEPEVVHDIPYFLNSRAVPHYDPQLSIPTAVVQRDFQEMTKADTGPMGTARVTTYMPTTGGRADIGPLPRWAVVYLLTMDQKARAVLFANADAGATIPIHYRDKKTDLPISLDDHPTLVMNVGHPSAADALPAAFGDTPWTPQIAHHPSLFYLPYLLTGDLFYLEEQAYWANWVLASVDPGYRNGAQGLVGVNEVRGQAWSMRTLTEAAMAMPDHHPLHAYFGEKLANNIAWYVSHYSSNTGQDQSLALGIIPKPDAPDLMAPWQQDYLFMVLGTVAEMGVAHADEIVRWLARFSVARWDSDAAGFCHQMAPSYYIKIKDSSLRFVSSLKEIFALNWPDTKNCPSAFPFGDPTSPGGYIANSHAALAIAVNLKIPGAAEAFNRLRGEAPGMVRAFSEDPTFAIVPR